MQVHGLPGNARLPGNVAHPDAFAAMFLEGAHGGFEDPCGCFGRFT